jgi:hypothetical protein
MTCSRLFLVLAIAVNEALSRAAAIETFAAASPIMNVIDQGIACRPRPYLNDKPAIGTGHYFCLHECFAHGAFKSGGIVTARAQMKAAIYPGWKLSTHGSLVMWRVRNPRIPSFAGTYFAAHVDIKSACSPHFVAGCKPKVVKLRAL